MSNQIEEFVKKLKDLESQMLKCLSESKFIDGRWASIAKTHFQEGSMASTRAAWENNQPSTSLVVPPFKYSA